MSKNIRLLIVEDDEDDYFLLTTSLRSTSFDKEIIWANTYNKAIELLSVSTPDLVIVDYRLGAHTGIELIAYISEKFPYTPTILLTGLRAPVLDQQALESGVYDYLVKDQYTSESLDRSIRYAIEKSRVLKSLKESENKFKNLFENAVEYVFIVNADLVVLDANKSALKLFELDSKNEIINETITDFIKPRIENIRDYLDSSEEIEVSIPQLSKKVACILNVSIADEEKTIYQVVLHDITERIQNEQKEKILEKQALTGKVARVIAHEIKNPLTNIHLSLAEIKAILLDKESKEDPLDFLEIIERNGKRINMLIEDLLNATRFDTMNFGDVYLHDLITETIDHVQDRIKLKDIHLEKDISENLLIKGDKEKLVIAVLNILVNAVEAISEKTGKIVISAMRTGDQAEIVIRDNGKGMPEEDKKRLFEPFFTSKKTGTGLGLTATYNIISKHEGLIEVDSEVGAGTEFRISFPLKGI
jgi:PAS domain S-box-containing protein